MKKKKISELDYETIERIVAMAREEKKPLLAIKNEFGYAEKEITELIKSKFPADEYEMWKKKIGAKKPKPKVMDDDFDELDSKYYIKNKFD
ncbi:DUF2805 domain-containing protein [Myroides ceti]|uniref:DUF2805 domain-containing protein n=2 Tax=Paenimyroides ceti TaxID=395087 RepID=A0ABT8CT17_9FLAO|nr:DUF2805 domain-containing protein [Paenimyroides ceti]